MLPRVKLLRVCPGECAPACLTHDELNAQAARAGRGLYFWFIYMFRAGTSCGGAEGGVEGQARVAAPRGGRGWPGILPVSQWSSEHFDSNRRRRRCPSAAGYLARGGHQLALVISRGRCAVTLAAAQPSCPHRGPATPSGPATPRSPHGPDTPEEDVHWSLLATSPGEGVTVKACCRCDRQNQCVWEQ